MSDTFQTSERGWDEFWAEFWRIRLVEEDEAIAWKNQQVAEFCKEVLAQKSGMRILDLGCGAGYQAILLAENDVEVHGVDIAPILIDYAREQAKKHKSQATFEVGDMRTYTTDTPFDCVVVLGMSFGFGTDVENRETMKRIYDAVKPGGKVLLTGQHPYAASSHTGPEWVETSEGFLLHRGEFDPITCRLGGSWQLARPDGSIVTEGDNPESDGIRCYTVPELTGLLGSVGFVNPKFFGSWMLPPIPLQWFSLEMISTADKPGL